MMPTHMLEMTPNTTVISPNNAISALLKLYYENICEIMSEKEIKEPSINPKIIISKT